MVNEDRHPESDLFRIHEGYVSPVLEDEDGNTFVAIEPGSREDPFTFRPSSLNDILYGLNKVYAELTSNPTLAREMLLRCQKTLQVFVEAEFEGEKEDASS